MLRKWVHMETFEGGLGGGAIECCDVRCAEQHDAAGAVVLGERLDVPLTASRESNIVFTPWRHPDEVVSWSPRRNAPRSPRKSSIVTDGRTADIGTEPFTSSPSRKAARNREAEQLRSLQTAQRVAKEIDRKYGKVGAGRQPFQASANSGSCSANRS